MSEAPEVVTDDNIKIIPDLHIVAEIPDQAVLDKVNALKEAIKDDPNFGLASELRPVYNESTLVRFLRARGGDVAKATDLLKEDIAWRASYRPHEFRCDRIESQAVTGKMRVSDTLDCHGRPVIVMHHKYENSKDEVGQLEYLVWALDHAIRRMSSPISKYSVFINQEGFSLWNAPPMKVSKEVAKCLSGRYPERLGHAVIWQPPFYFRAFYAIVSPFIDGRTKNKILMIHGEHGPGSKNDRVMTRVFGSNWREICGIDQDQIGPTIAPGYSHEVSWPKVQAFEGLYFAAGTEEAREAARVSVYGQSSMSPDPAVAEAIAAARAAIAAESKTESKDLGDAKIEHTGPTDTDAEGLAKTNPDAAGHAIGLTETAETTPEQTISPDSPDDQPSGPL